MPASLPHCPFALPLTVRYHDASGPLAVDATVTDCRSDDRGSDPAGSVKCRIGRGTLRDADKGAFQLDGLELRLHVANGRFSPLVVIDPGDLSEFQQEGLLDAVCSVLNELTSRHGDHV